MAKRTASLWEVPPDSLAAMYVTPGVYRVRIRDGWAALYGRDGWAWDCNEAFLRHHCRPWKKKEGR